jgi:hypothetical protein
MKKIIATAALLLGLVFAPGVSKADDVIKASAKAAEAADSSAYVIDGKIYKTDLEAGCYYLDSAGAKYMLTGSDEMLNKVLRMGADVELKVVPDPDAVTACMVGPALRIVDVIKVEKPKRASSDYKPMTRAEVSI